MSEQESIQSGPVETRPRLPRDQDFVDFSKLSDPLDFERLSDKALDRWLSTFNGEVSDQDIEQLKPLRNAIDELRTRYDETRKVLAEVHPDGDLDDGKYITYSELAVELGKARYAATTQRRLWLEYVALLTEEYSELVSLAFPRGWRSNQERVDRGEELRKKLGIPGNARLRMLIDGPKYQPDRNDEETACREIDGMCASHPICELGTKLGVIPLDRLVEKLNELVRTSKDAMRALVEHRIPVRQDSDFIARQEFLRVRKTTDGVTEEFEEPTGTYTTSFVGIINSVLMKRSQRRLVIVVDSDTRDFIKFDSAHYPN